ncbi:hypothetical protein ACTXT7_017094, partial [Hymenolepis weldensis]
VTSTVTRGISSDVFNQKDVSSERQRLKSTERTHSPSSNLPSEPNKSSSQDDKISIFLSLLLPEAIQEIKEAISAEPDMVAQRVRAIVVRHLGPEILSKFFSNSPSFSSHNHRQNINKNGSKNQSQEQQQQTHSSASNSTFTPNNRGGQNLPSPQTSSNTLTTSLTCPGRVSSASSETSLCGSSGMEITSSSGSGKTAGGQLLRESSAAAPVPTTATSTTRPASALGASSNSFSAHPQPPKRPSLVQELSVPPSEPDSLPLPPPPPPALFSSPSSSSSNVDFQTFFGLVNLNEECSTSPWLYLPSKPEVVKEKTKLVMSATILLVIYQGRSCMEFDVNW